MLSTPFQYKDRNLYVDHVDLESIARKAGTPLYVYSASAIRERFLRYKEAFADTPHTICYAVKANSNLSVLRLLAAEGSGFDIVSGGELFRVLKAGGQPDKVVFSGVGKTREEVEYALAEGIHSFNCESASELSLIDSIATRLGKIAKVSLRVNPHVDAQTHPYISTGLKDHKFGIDIDHVEQAYLQAAAAEGLSPEGVSCHIGSQLLSTTPLLEALEAVLQLVEHLRAKGLPIAHLDLGGGLGVPYKQADNEPDVAEHIQAICRRTAGLGLTLMVEPGRSIVGPAGALVSRVLYRKSTGTKEFIVLDAAMNDLIRPALYKAHHEIVPLRQAGTGTVVADIVGPICESGDFFAEGREVANAMPGDFMALLTAGAYGFTLASNYNSRPRAAEVLVDGDTWSVVRQRESLEDLIRGE